MNRNFVIRYQFDEDRKTSLIGAGRYILLLEKAKDANKMCLAHFQKAIEKAETVKESSIRLRGGLTVWFNHR